MMLLLTLLFVAILSTTDVFSISPSDVTNAVERSKEFEGKIDYNNKYSDEMKKEADKTSREFQKKIMPLNR